MLQISLDEAYVFDILSIHHVKLDKASDNPDKYDVVKKSFDFLSDEIKNQIGEPTFLLILNSDEYINLKRANEIVFDLVDRANETELSRITAEANLNRFRLKTKLQDKFFSQKLTEIKL